MICPSFKDKFLSPMPNPNRPIRNFHTIAVCEGGSFTALLGSASRAMAVAAASSIWNDSCHLEERFQQGT